MTSDRDLFDPCHDLAFMISSVDPGHKHPSSSIHLNSHWVCDEVLGSKIYGSLANAFCKSLLAGDVCEMRKIVCNLKEKILGIWRINCKEEMIASKSLASETTRQKRS